MASSSASGKEAIRIVTAQSGRSFRAWKVSAWLTLTMLNMNIAEQKGRGKYRWGFASLFTGPLTTIFLTFTGSKLDHPDSVVPRSAVQMYSLDDQPVKATLVAKSQPLATPPSATPPVITPTPKQEKTE